MATLKGKIALKLLLIIAMVIQPVAISHAMAGMNHSQHQTMSADMQSYDEHHGMRHAALDIQREAHETEDDSLMNDCCNTSACCPAAAVGITSLEHTPAPVYLVLRHISWEGVILLSETKPPKRFFA